MHVLFLINSCIGILFLLCYAYQLFYIPVALVKKRREHTSPVRMHRFAVLISARNEEAVIEELVASIKRQTYPSEFVKTIVVADNCTDKTAEICRKAGCIVYERFDMQHIGKGYALNFLFDAINRDYPRDEFDAFFVFDADNILSPTYIEEMNKTYSDGYLALTSYRNSKNYGDNWISAGYSLWFLRESKYLNNSRMILGTSCAVSGTGFMLDRTLVEDEEGIKKWCYYLLTEDIEFTTASIIDGLKIGYCDTAEFFDEQPVKFSQSFWQRMRWAKGYLQVYRNYGKKLLAGIFGKKCKDGTARPKWSCFSCFDMSMTTMPALILTGTVLLVDVVAGLVFLFGLGRIKIALSLFILPFFNASIITFLIGVITTISEWSNIHTTSQKKIFYMITFPLFMLTYIPIALIAIFKKVDWKPIEHAKTVTLSDIESTGVKQPLETEKSASDDVKKQRVSKGITEINK